MHSVIRMLERFAERGVETLSTEEFILLPDAVTHPQYHLE